MRQGILPSWHCPSERNESRIPVMKIVAVANQKGGVGKTTTSVNLAASLAAMGRQVLLVDLDPQGNATMSSGVDKQAAELTTYDLLVDELPLNEVMVPAADSGYFVVPANRNLTAAEVELLDVDGRERRLAKALSSGYQFDLIIIDCPPSLSMLTINALVAAQSVIVTMQCGVLCLRGSVCPAQYHSPYRGHGQPKAKNRGYSAYHVRPQKLPDRGGIEGTAETLWRFGVPDSDTA